MSLWIATALGLVQALTEFLPVSSTAHLLVFGELFGQSLGDDRFRAFVDIIQTGTTLAVIVYFRADLLRLARAALSAAYMGRYIAKNVVAAGLARRCEVQVAYAIGVAEPVSVMVDTFGTGAVAEEKIAAAVREVFDLKPRAIIQGLDLLRPIYEKTAAYGHFGRTEKEFTWERVDRKDALRDATGLSKICA